VLIEDNGVPLIMDFGISKVIESQVTHCGSANTTGGKGSARWQAPELFGALPDISLSVSNKTDVYAFACVCIEVWPSETNDSDCR
jgi:serine/threonine protein kinase